MSDVLIERKLTNIIPATAFVDVTLDRPLVDPTKAFVRQVSTDKYCQMIVSPPTVNYNVNRFSATVEILNSTTVRVKHKNTIDAKAIYWEVWEYVGDPGGPDEFLVLAADSIQIAALGGLVIPSWSASMTNPRDVFVFTRGMEWAGSQLGAAKNAGSGAAILACAYFGPYKILLAQRSVNDALNEPIHYYSAVEFVGANWETRWGFSYTPPASIDSVPLYDHTGALSPITSWANTAIYAQRAASNHVNASQGLVAWEGINTSSARLQYAVSSARVPSYDWYYLQTLGHLRGSAVYDDSITGGGTAHPGSTGQQVIDTPITYLQGEQLVGLFISGANERNFIHPPSFVWVGKIEAPTTTSHTVRWYRARADPGVTDWSYRILKIPFDIEVELETIADLIRRVHSLLRSDALLEERARAAASLESRAWPAEPQLDGRARSDGAMLREDRVASDVDPELDERMLTAATLLEGGDG